MSTSTYLESQPLEFQSSLLSWLEHHPQRKALASQWLGMMLNQQGIRQEEIERAGLPEFLYPLRESNRRITIDELIAIAASHLEACHPVIRTSRKLSFNPTLDLTTEPDERPEHFDERARPFIEMAQTCHRHPAMNYWIIRTAYEDLITVAPNWIVLDDSGNLVSDITHDRCWFSTAVEAFDVLHHAVRSRFDGCGHVQPDNMFEQYSLPGGKNYQEWFVCLPDWPLPYIDSHFGLDRLLIHLRTTERTDIHGQPIFMVEEIQSPWHADGRSLGMSTNIDEIGNGEVAADAPFIHEWHELGIKVAICLAIRRGFDRIGFTTGDQQCNRWGNREGLRNLYDQDVPQCLRKIVRQFGCSLDVARIETRKPIADIRYARGEGWQLRNTQGRSISPSIWNKDIALFYLENQSPKIHDDIRTLKLSPRLVQDATAGKLPLFGWWRDEQKASCKANPQFAPA